MGCWYLDHLLHRPLINTPACPGTVGMNTEGLRIRCRRNCSGHVTKSRERYKRAASDWLSVTRLLVHSSVVHACFHDLDDFGPSPQFDAQSAEPSRKP